MPTYKLGVVGRELSFETDESLSKSIGKKLQDPEPQTWIDGGGSMGKSRWRQQEYSREKLLEYKKVRESGGPVASLLESKSLINFGTGSEFVAEESDLADWLNEEGFPERDNLFINIGKDGFTYPYAVTEAVETRGGDFSHVEFIEPWTMVPKTDDKGRIMQWEQQVKVDGNVKTKPVDPDEVAHFVLNRSSGRDKTGISLIEQNRDEIERFYDNQDSIKNGMQLHGFPQRHISVGREGAGVIDDNELRRVRQRFTGKINEMTAWFTGKDVDVETLETHDFDFQGITENDLKVLTMSFLLPQELANVGSDGLGSGMPAELRKELLLISVQAKQRALANQFIDQMVRPVVENYTEFDADQRIEIEWQEPLSDKSDKIEDATSMDEYMTTNEVREKAGLPPLDDEEQGESFEPPGAGQEQDEPFGGMLNGESRSMADPMINGHDLDPGTGEGVCENTGEDIEAKTMEDLEQDCPHCGEPLSAFGVDTGNANLADGELDIDEFEATLEGLHENFVCAEDTNKQLTEFNESMLPEMVKQRLKDAIRGGALFSEFDSIPSSELMELRGYFADTLSEDGWSLDEMATEISDKFGVGSDRAETIARTETQSVVNHAAEESYREFEEERGEEFKFKWVGSYNDGRVTDACKWLLEQTNPKHGGTPVPLDELKELIQEAPEHDDSLDDNMAREFTPHINCRKRYVRHVE